MANKYILNGSLFCLVRFNLPQFLKERYTWSGGWHEHILTEGIDVEGFDVESLGLATNNGLVYLPNMMIYWKIYTACRVAMAPALWKFIFQRQHGKLKMEDLNTHILL